MGFRQLSADEPVQGSFLALFFIQLLIHERKPGSLLRACKVRIFCILCVVACACKGAYKCDCKNVVANVIVKMLLLIEQEMFGKWLHNLLTVIMVL